MAEVKGDTIYYAGRTWPRCTHSTYEGGRCSKPCLHGKEMCAKHHEKQYAAEYGKRRGARSAYNLGPGLKDAYEQALADPELLSLRTAVAVVETRICELVENLSADASLEVWKDLTAELAKLREARKASDATAAARATLKIEELITEGASAGQKWADLFAAIKIKKEVAAAEWARMTDLRVLMTADKAMLIVNAILDSVTRNVADPKARKQISQDVRATLQNVRPDTPTTLDRARKQAEEHAQGEVLDGSPVPPTP